MRTSNANFLFKKMIKKFEILQQVRFILAQYEKKLYVNFIVQAKKNSRLLPRKIVKAAAYLILVYFLYRTFPRRSTRSINFTFICIILFRLVQLNSTLDYAYIYTISPTPLSRLQVAKNLIKFQTIPPLSHY